MKFNVSAVLATVLAVSANAFAVYDPTWERPIFRAEDMEIQSVQHGFDDVEKVDITLTKRDGQRRMTGMNVSMEVRHSNQPVNKRLVINQIQKDACGSTVYYASLPPRKTPKNVRIADAMSGRFNVTLTDHTTRLCHDLPANTWEASIREGYGWCGTMDATMELSGEPEGVYTIQSIRP